MPLIHNFAQGPMTMGWLWLIEEEFEELWKLARPNIEDQIFVAGLGNESRKKEVLACRALLNGVWAFPTDSSIQPSNVPVIRYQPNGKPYLKGSSLSISLTHSRGIAGILLSRELSCGLDIERIDPRLTRVARRFVGPSEEGLGGFSNSDCLNTLIWTAKECMVKYTGNRELDFLEEMQVLFVHHETDDRGWLELDFRRGNMGSVYRISWAKWRDCMLCWLAGGLETGLKLS